MRRSPRHVEAEYVVVGAGSAGCIVAARLAEAGHRVVLVEAGGSDDRYLVRRPGMTGPMHVVPQLHRRVDWGYATVPQQHALGRRIPQYRGKVMGGSASVNGMLWVRGNRSNYDAWAAEGNKGWDADSVNEVYRSIEDFEDGEDCYRGAGGPVGITRFDGVTDAADLFNQATAEALGTRVVGDYNGADQEGSSRVQANIRAGVRQSSSRAYLHGRELPSLRILRRHRATRVLFEGEQATGVHLVDGRGRPTTVRATREVVLSSGAFNSPQLLMLSGVGPAAHLRRLGIDTLVDLPVGDNLHDHLFVPVTHHAKVPRKGSVGPYLAAILKDLCGGSSFVQSTHFESLGFVRSSLAAQVPDVQLHMLPWSYPSPNSDRADAPRDAAPSLTVLSTMIYPKSRGTLRLASADPLAAPLIDFDYLAHPDDREVLAQGVEMIRRVMSTPTMRTIVEPELHPGLDLTGEDLREEVRLRATTVYHAVGSCRMGTDERAVVDPELRVRGLSGIRVADASIMPSITGGNTNAPSMMIGEQAARLILGEGQGGR